MGQQNEHLQWLSGYLGVVALKHELKKALTHKSFYADGKNDGNSRYIFIGMYGFKGHVANILYQYVAATGTQLQHYLGNLFKPEVLDRLYDRLNLKESIRYGSEIDPVKQKHLFAYALLGFVSTHCTEKERTHLIIRHFLTGTEHLLPNHEVNKDVLSQCNYFARLIHQCNVTVTVLKEADDTFSCVVLAGNNELARGQSKSIRYVRKKVVKQALLQLVAGLNRDYLLNPLYQKNETVRLKKEEEAQKTKAEERHQKHIEKQRLKTEAREQRAQQRHAIQQQRDQARRQAKQNAKIKQQKNEEQQQKNAAASKPMSGKKRRFLEDKQK